MFLGIKLDADSESKIKKRLLVRVRGLKIEKKNGQKLGKNGYFVINIDFYTKSIYI